MRAWPVAHHVDPERTILAYLDDGSEHFADLAGAIRARPETALQERYASRRPESLVGR